MTPSPIRKVLFTFRRRGVRALLMGGQACIAYGAAEFSRDVDFAVLCDSGNLQRLRAALRDLRAVRVYVPPLDERHLRRGHACHFRCGVPGAVGLRIDVMSVMRGCDAFEMLWRRRRVLRLPRLGVIDLLGLADLAAAKRTQRDKDWGMVRRLVEADYVRGRHPAPGDRARFWLLHLRTPDLLAEAARRYPRLCRALEAVRPLLRHARPFDRGALERGLKREERREREADRRYWAPLRHELFAMRQARRRARRPARA